MPKKPLYPHIPKSAVIRPVEAVEREYEEFIKPYWDRIGEVLVHKESLAKMPDKLYKEAV